MMTEFTSNRDETSKEPSIDTPSSELLKRQDSEKAIEFLKAEYPYIVEESLPGFEVLSVIGHLLRENRMLQNLVKSESSDRIPHLQTKDSHPPFDEQPKFEQPCRAVDLAAGRTVEAPVRAVKGLDLNPASIRRMSGQDQFRYRKHNAGRIK